MLLVCLNDGDLGGLVRCEKKAEQPIHETGYRPILKVKYRLLIILVQALDPYMIHSRITGIMLRERETVRGSWIWGSRSWPKSFFDLNGPRIPCVPEARIVIADLDPRNIFHWIPTVNKAI